MTSVPSEVEEAAREVAHLYVLSEEEIDVLASDHRFAVTAYLRRETGEWIEALGFPVTGGRVGVEDGELVVDDVETVDAETAEGKAVAFAWFGYNAYVEASEVLAEAIVGHPIKEDPRIGELIRETVADGGEL